MGAFFFTVLVLWLASPFLLMAASAILRHHLVDVTPVPKPTCTPKRGLVRVPLKIRGRRSAGWNRSRQWCFERAAGRCEAQVWAADCTGRAEHALHMQLRSQGGSDDPANLLAVCHRCHRWIHDNPAAAQGLGLLRRREAS